MKEIFNKLITKIDESQIALNEPMKAHTTFKVGGPADMFIKVKDIESLKFVLQTAKEYNMPITLIGNGSNILVKDKGIRGIVIKLDFKEINKIDEETLNVGAGVLLAKLSRNAYEEGLTGLEFACGIPASMGGAVYMNAGAYGKEMGDIIISTKYLDESLEIKTIKNSEHEFSYRKTVFQKKNWIILNSIIKLKQANKEEIKNTMEKYSMQRKSKQPINMPSAGSTFKRGDNYITAEIIDKCGLKGYNIGGAFVSNKHAGFVVNNGNATAKDVLELIQYIKAKVKEKFNIEIEEEIKILGED